MGLGILPLVMDQWVIVSNIELAKYFDNLVCMMEALTLNLD